MKKLALILPLIIGLMSCGSGGSGNSTPPPSGTPTPVAISISPATTTLVPAQKQQFLVDVTMSDKSVSHTATYSASGDGTVDPNTGIFTAGASDGSASVTAAAESVSLVMSSSVTVQSPTGPIPTFVQAVACGTGQATSCTLNATAGNTLVYFLFSLTLPAGQKIDLTDSQYDDFSLHSLWTVADGNSGGLAEMAVAVPIAGGSTTISPPNGSTLVFAEFSGVSMGDPVADGLHGPTIQSGVAGAGAAQPIYALSPWADKPNSLALNFVLAVTNQTLSAGVSGTQILQFANGNNLAFVLQDAPLPIPNADGGSYTTWFIPSNPPQFLNLDVAIFKLVLQP